MATDTEVPITVAADAQEFIGQQGMEREFEAMLEHTRQTVTGLRAIEVVLDADPGQTTGLGIVIWAYREHAGQDYDPTARQWGKWKIQTFPPAVCMNFVLLTDHGAPPNGR